MTEELSLELNSANLPEFLAEVGWVYHKKNVKVRELSGGVSNRAFWVEDGQSAFVVKQARPRLAVEMEWKADVKRIIREAMALQWLGQRIGPPQVPRLLNLDREHLVLMMEAIPEPAENYKSRLLRGDVDPALAEAFGTLLARIHNATCDEMSHQNFADTTYFEQLRLNPYYATAAERNPEVAPRLEALQAQCLEEGYCLVHGDYSPKNVLIGEEGPVLLDYEVAHWGHPSFDIGFALTHFLAKAIHLPARAELFLAAARVFWKSYRKRTGLPDRVWEDTGYHLAGLMLARVDGKSPLEYLREDRERAALRNIALEGLRRDDTTVLDLFKAVEQGRP